MGSATEPGKSLIDLLANHDQTHLLQFWDELTTHQQEQLETEIKSLDFEQLKQLAAVDANQSNPADLISRANPPSAWKTDKPFGPFDNQQAIEAGEQALADGKVGMILVAGGQGTRLGFNKPKGMFPLGPLSNRTLFQILFDLLNARGKRYGKPIPIFIMTSLATHEQTIEYLNENEWLGLAPEQVNVFCQGEMPAVSLANQKVLLSEKHKIAMSPDGHGGMLSAFERSGCLEKVKASGIEHLFYGQVDNPLMQLCDPLFVGSHLLTKSEMTTQVVRKESPRHRVGNVVSIDGQLCIIEYSDLPDNIAELTDENGKLKFWAGSIAVHVIDTSFLDRMANTANSLPFHVAKKKVPYVDGAGNFIEPVQPNAIKFEKFIFDMLPYAENALVVEVDPAEGFAPVKNAADAATETAATSQAAMIEQHRRWIDEAGLSIDESIKVEINPMFALDAGDLKNKLDAKTCFTEDVYLL